MEQDLYAPEASAGDTVPLNVRISPDLKEAFETLCKEKKVSMSTVIRRFIESQTKNVSKRK